MSAELRLIKSEDEKPPKGAHQNRANSGRIAGNAKMIVARQPAYPYRLKVCKWCQQPIKPGTLYVMQDRWLRDSRGRWHEKGPRHDNCWALEGEH